MAPNPVADFTPFDADLRLRRRSFSPVVFQFGGLDLTGYTAPIFRWGQNIATGDPDGSVAGVLTPGANSVIQVTLDRSSFWTPLGSRDSGDWELGLLTPLGEPVGLVGGEFRVEGSFLP